MIAPEHYYSIYLLVILFVTIFVTSGYRQPDRSVSANQLWTLIFAVIIAIYIGFRPVDKVFADMVGYDIQFEILSGTNFSFSWDTDNIIFDNLKAFLACSGIGSRSFFILISLIYFLCTYVAIRKIFRGNTSIAYLVWLASFSTFSYGTNGIKAGAAAALFLVALSYIYDHRPIPCILFILLSLGFHHSMILPAVAVLICLLCRNPKVFVAFWLFSFFMAAFHITYFQEIFGSIVDEQGAIYLLGDGHDIKSSVFGGFRIDFILYSAVPIVIGLVCMRNESAVTSWYKFLFSLYTLVNAIWLLCMYAEFTNRIAFLSWLMFPIVLVYPYLEEFLKNESPIRLKFLIFGNLMFTMFMKFVYYG